MNRDFWMWILVLSSMAQPDLHISTSPSAFLMSHVRKWEIIPYTIAQAIMFFQFHRTIAQLNMVYPEKTDLLPRRQNWTFFRPTPICKDKWWWGLLRRTHPAFDNENVPWPLHWIPYVVDNWPANFLFQKYWIISFMSSA